MNPCDPIEPARFRLQGTCPGCAFSGRDSALVDLSELAPPGLCPHAFLVLVPYWLAFNQGAAFQWRTDLATVVCQCPAAEGPVFLVARGGPPSHPTVTATVQSAPPGRCAWNLAPGSRFNLAEAKVCPALFPALFLAASMPDRALPRIQCCTGNGRFALVPAGP